MRDPGTDSGCRRSRRSSLCAARAQGDGGTLEEVVVTAQKRVESLQDVPLAISANSGDKLADAGINKIEVLRNYARSFARGHKKWPSPTNRYSPSALAKGLVHAGSAWASPSAFQSVNTKVTLRTTL